MLLAVLIDDNAEAAGGGVGDRHCAEKLLLQQCESTIQRSMEANPELLVFLSVGDPALRKIPKLPAADVTRIKESVEFLKARNEDPWRHLAFIPLESESQHFLEEKHDELVRRWPSVDRWELAKALVDLIAV